MRALFGGDPNLIETNGIVRLNKTSQTVTIWDSETGGTQYTDLRAADGTTVIDRVTSPGRTLAPFYGENNDVAHAWVDTGDGDRELILGTFPGAAPKLTGGRNDLTPSTRTAGTTNPQIIVIGTDPVDGVIFGRNDSSGSIVISEDGGATWSGAKGGPAGTDVLRATKMVRFGDHVWLLSEDTASGAGGVWRAAPVLGSTAYTWSSAVLVMGAGANEELGCIMNAGATSLMVGEYGDPTAGPAVYKISLADANGAGTNWTTSYGPDAAIRHIHGLAEDPFNPGTWWATMGDGIGAKAIQVSEDDGATWTPVAPSEGGWQAVQVSFCDRYVWFAADMNGGSVFVMDRTERVPMWATPSWHHHIPTAGYGRKGGLYFTDGEVTSGSKTLTSATAGFTQADRGRYVIGDGIWLNTYIESVQNATTVTMTNAARSTVSPTEVSMSGDQFYSNAYFGAVDPDTGRYYGATATGSQWGNSHAMFLLATPGGQLTTLNVPPRNAVGNAEVHVFDGQVFWERYRRPLHGAMPQP